MSKKKAGGKAAQHERPEGKRLGLKISSGQKVSEGVVLVRQRGTKMQAGFGVKVGRDHTLYSVKSGVAKISQKLGKKVVSVLSK